MKENPTIAIIGLGYVGLPLAVAFAKKYKVIGFDINTSRVDELIKFNDSTLEVSRDDLEQVVVKDFEKVGLFITHNEGELSKAQVFIVTVPTPVDKNNRPVLIPLEKASRLISRYLKPNDVVIYESTVYPGVTEEVMVPILEESNLIYNSGFSCGYSPERINPGDKEHTVTKILKVTSGSTHETALFVDNLYKSVITAGTYLATSIKVAEAAKVIENSQRDINIAFVNELAKIFELLEIDTTEVLQAAGTKWNFLPFKPGLVGGHCIGVDPYYLAQKAQEVGYHPEIILAGRRLNDGMGKYIASECVKLMLKNDLQIRGAKALILGITFKENCPDIRNSKVIDVHNELVSYGLDVDVFDPWASSVEVKHEFSIDLIQELKINYSLIVLAVSHREFYQINVQNQLIDNGVVYDVKSFLPKATVTSRL
ncbi:nucleotide sugar dehydrogenase [Schleiferiaceae bacterium]|nr:nucleotide sugar dehydrogenase [Schleiferiaceae bacterium]